MRLTGQDQFDNIAFFVSDSMRYDSSLVEFEKNSVLKTVAGGVSSPPGFASIITGQYPSSHHVLDFNHRLDTSHLTIFDLRPHTSFYNEGVELGNVLGTSDTVSHKTLDQLETPFIYFERDLQPHAPYNHDESYNEPVRDYCRRKRGNVRDDYNASIKNSIEKFKRRVDTLRKREILNDTLVIFTADHGEAFGEHGFHGHGSATLPELVYTPTVIYNETVAIEGKPPIGHVDFLPTVAHAVKSDYNMANHRGKNLFEEATDNQLYFNQRSDDEWSVWDESGGYVFTNPTPSHQIIRLAFHLIGNSYSSLQRQHMLRLIKTMFDEIRKNTIKFGKPDFDAQEAFRFATPLLKDNQGKPAETRADVDKDHLRDLGYFA